MTATVTFSAVDNADITLLLQALGLTGSAKLAVVEDLQARDRLEYRDGDLVLTSRLAVVKALAGHSIGLGGAEGERERLLVEQWLEFACTRVLKEMRDTKDLDSVLAPLQEELAKRTFLGGGQTPSVADWAIFALTFAKIKAMTPSVAAKYFRLVRWASYLQHILMKGGADGGGQKGSTETSAFSPATFDLSAIRAALNGTAVIGSQKVDVDEKGGKKGKKGNDDKKGNDGKKESDSKKEEHKAKPAPEQAVALHPFARVDLRVGKIVKVEKHPNADRLYVEHVDLGEAEARVVVSGLVEHVPAEELDGRLCVFICNLKPATLCKVLSSAMLLVAKQGDGALEPLIVPEGCKPGDRIVIEGVTAQPDEVIKPKDTTWENVRQQLKMVDGVALYESLPLQVAGKGSITSRKISTGIIS